MPAVVILDEVRAMVVDTHAGQQLLAIDHCKFQDFVLPDQPFRIALTALTASTASGVGVIDFTCSAVDDGRLLASGRMRLTPEGAAV